ncbi:right-handed parallel beta-helix repeat-containing protein [Mycolicibacterium sp. S3B2]|uniref:right-handed parallel beta-helix repeat-containing protein n=1 Tax=Mycolicibacterium sp. S3B2 TaxID=3415120 RepID=UPI003C7DF39B
MASDDIAAGRSTPGPRATMERQAGSRPQRERRRIQPYAWLAAGAVGVGITAAMTGSAGVAYAEDSASSSAAASGDTAANGAESADSKGSPSSPADTDTDADDQTSDEDLDNDLDSAEDLADDLDSVEDDADEESSEVVDPDLDDVPDLDDDPDLDDRHDDDLVDTSPSRDGRPPAEQTQTDASAAPSGEDILDLSDDVDTDVAPAGGGSDASEEDSSAATEAVQTRSVDPATTRVEKTELASRSQPVSMPVTDTSSAALATGPPVAPSTLSELLTAFFVRLQATFFNQSPRSNPQQHAGQSSGGAVTGTVGATDPDGDPLAVSLASGPSKGSVVIHADGTYTYSPDAALAASGGKDTFVVRITETNAASHYHGFKGMWSAMVRTMTFGRVSPDDGSSITQVVTVTVARVAGGSENPDTVEVPPGDYDAGLSEPFELPDAVSGRTLDVRDYGASSNRSSNNDAHAIQAAIDAAAPGDKVYIPDGVYHVKSTINLKSGVSLYGQSRAGTVLAAAFATSPHAVIYAAPGVTNLTVSSFSITVASGAQIKAGIRLGAEGGAAVSRIMVNNLAIEDFQRFGVQLQNARHVLVDGNTIKNATALDGGGSGYGVIIDQVGSHNNWVRNNTIGPVIRHGILIQSAHHNLIESNTVTGAVSGAIDLHGEDEYSNEISYNTVSDCVRDGTTVSPNGAGIEVGEYSGVIGTVLMHDNSGPHNWIHHNVVYNCTCGVSVVNNSDNTYIENNVFYNNLEAGIKAQIDLQHLYIRGNTIYGNGSGIVLMDVSHAVVHGNSVTDNDQFGIWTNGGVTDYTITANTVTGNLSDVSLSSPSGVYNPGVTA